MKCPPGNRVAAESVSMTEISHGGMRGDRNMEEAAGYAVRVLKGVGLLAFNVVGSVGDLLAIHIPWKKERERSATGE